MFMFLSFIFDLYKQAIFIASTGEAVKGDHRVFLKRQFRLQIGLVGAQMFFMAVSLSLIIILMT